MSWSISYLDRSVAANNFMTLVSRGLPVFASNADALNPATAAVDSDYNTFWLSTGLPATFAIDISTKVGAIVADSGGFKPVVFTFGSPDIDFKQGVSGANLTDVPGNYTIDVNSAASGGSAPTTGWTTAVTVTGNTLKNRAHIVNVAGQNWIRLSATTDVAGGTTGCKLGIDLWDASNATTNSNTQLNCGILTVTDSIGAFGLARNVQSGVNSRSALGDQVFASAGKRTFQMDAGHEGYKSSDITSLIASYVAAWPGKYVMVALGTNDATASRTASAVKADLITIGNSISSGGKISIFPTIMWPNIPANDTLVQTYNAQIPSVISSVSGAIAGPDLYAYFSTHQSDITASDVHPTAAGYVDYMTQHVNFCISGSLY